MTNSQDYFQVIDSQYELIESIKEEASKSKKKIYEITITPSKQETDLNLVENQFYNFEVFRLGQKICSIERRYSQFALIFQILSKKEPGFIFPAFPSNDLMAYMKSKVSMVKDQQFIKRRLLIISRFFNVIFNEPEFHPEINKEIKEFLSTGKEFQARKQIQKNSTGIFNLSWNKFKTYFQISKENKYFLVEQKIQSLKQQYGNLHGNCVRLIELLREEFQENNKLISYNSENYLTKYLEMIGQYMQEQAFHLKELQNLQLNLFCEIEDLLMVNRIIQKINQLKNNEENYNELIKIQERFNSRIEQCINLKARNRIICSDSLRTITEDIKQVGRLNS